jgi:hypothetical protein
MGDVDERLMPTFPHIAKLLGFPNLRRWAGGERLCAHNKSRGSAACRAEPTRRSGMDRFADRYARSLGERSRALVIRVLHL